MNLFSARSVTSAGSVGSGFTLELYAYDFGAIVEGSDWRSNTVLNSGTLTLLASSGVTTSSSGVLTFTLNGTELKSYLQGKLSGNSRFVLVSNRQRTNAPLTASGNEYITLNGSACELSFTVD